MEGNEVDEMAEPIKSGWHRSLYLPAADNKKVPGLIMYLLLTRRRTWP
ncbi:MAG: hypothetical protein ETSY2_06755 [Candidatus Entotheonella gemina]|uniref:Uncharacterized protein n=1 Tax=Candidatus Entotheonella gemina TaxID=1429439 RepID=W4ME48_9BACT|nr:MAG: hypothetical protein ETSY2_06755 [Candidatus Entotheonella gemina]